MTIKDAKEICARLECYDETLSEENPFFGNLTIMKYLIKNLYELKAPDLKHTDLFDLYELLTKPVKVSFKYDGEEFIVKSVEEDGEIVINFDGKWFRTVDYFFAKASIDGLRLVVIGWEKILSTDPYQYRFLLEDEEKVQEYKEELEEYTRYEKQLIDILKKYVAGGAKFTWEN